MLPQNKHALFSFSGSIQELEQVTGFYLKPKREVMNSEAWRKHNARRFGGILQCSMILLAMLAVSHAF